MSQDAQADAHNLLKLDIDRVAADLEQLDHDKVSVPELKQLEEKMIAVNDKFK